MLNGSVKVGCLIQGGAEQAISNPIVISQFVIPPQQLILALYCQVEQ